MRQKLVAYKFGWNLAQCEAHLKKTELAKEEPRELSDMCYFRVVNGLSLTMPRIRQMVGFRDAEQKNRSLSCYLRTNPEIIWKE